MNLLLVHFGLFFLLIVSTYFISRKSINNFFYFLNIFIKNRKIVFSIISVFFFPGTIIHELAHFFCAIILMLKVREVNIFPKIEDNSIKLGSVIYEKKDTLRGILVGVAPIVLGLGIFLGLSFFNLFPHDDFYINILLIYLIYIVSTTMFSSKKDLVDIIFVIPLCIVLAGIVYIFNIKIDFIFNNSSFINNLTLILGRINYYLLISVVINIMLIIIFKLFNLFAKYVR